MKSAQRIPWVALTTVEFPMPRSWGEVGFSTACLCIWCRYGKWEGGCQDGYPVCRHPLLNGEAEAFEGDGTDCWAFQPNRGEDIEKAADMVGLWLQGQEVAGEPK